MRTNWAIFAQFDGVLQLPFIKGSPNLITSKELFLNQIPFQYSTFYGILFICFKGIKNNFSVCCSAFCGAKHSGPPLFHSGGV